MKELFYSKQEKILFWVAGYTADLNTYNLSEQLKSLNDNALMFLVGSGWDRSRINDVYSTEILNSRRYKRMRVFWIDNIGEETIPKESYVIGKLTGEPPHKDDWTMWKWLND